MKRLALLCLLLLIPFAAGEDTCPEDPDCEPDDPDELEPDGNGTGDEENETSEAENATDESDDLEAESDDGSESESDDDGVEDDFDEDVDDEADDDDFDDDDEGFTDRKSGVRYEEDENRFQVPGHIRLDHQFLEVIEFEDRDGDGAYDPGEPILARYDLTRSPDAVAGVDVKRITYHIGDGELHLDVRNAGDATKFDVTIQDYAFTSETSRIALGSRISVDEGLRTGSVGGEPALLGTGAGERPYVSWIPTVMVDGQEADVSWSAFVSLDDDGGTGTLYWAYPQGASIVHDPRLGITSITLERALDAKVFLIAGAAAVAFLAVGVVRRR